MKPPGHGSADLREINSLTSRIIACAIAVHRTLGPGLLESIYESALCIEFADQSISYARQVQFPTYYKGRLLGNCRIDLVIADMVLVEVKAVEKPNPLFEAQLLSYLRLANRRVGLLVNFNSRLLVDGVKRFIL